MVSDMTFINITEQPSLYNDLENKPVSEILTDINREDQKVALAVQQTIPEIEKLVNGIVERMKRGGRLFYIGAGTSGGSACWMLRRFPRHTECPTPTLSD